MGNNQRFLSTLAFWATFFAFGVIALGAFTRLIDAGLGCPDWPGCYGHLLLPIGKEKVDTALVAYKAWAEMMHRYFVSGLSLFILGIVATILIQKSYRTRSNFIYAILLIVLLVYQILLGKWTVTHKLLPIVVTQHLLGGFFIISTLWLIYLNNNHALKSKLVKPISNLLLGALIGLLLLLLQISLGAWTSTNYASLSCPDFPFCVNDKPTMMLHIKAAFNSFSPTGINYEGGILPTEIRQTIQIIHRAGALILATYLFGFLFYALEKLKNIPEISKTIYIILGLLSIQICIGITIVILKLPLLSALAHNLVAVLLLLSLITLIYKLIISPKAISE